MMKYILSIDQGTTGTKAILLNSSGVIHGRGYRAHSQIHPAPGWVEHDVEEIWQCILDATSEAMSSGGIRPGDIVAVAMANQGETVVPFQRSTGKSLHNAIVWSDRRTVREADRLATDTTWAASVQQVTGLRIDPYFSATKMQWFLEHVEAVRQAAEQGDLCVSTLDAWMIHRMTGGSSYRSDTSTASRTLLLNVHTLEYEPEHLQRFGVPRGVLPEVRDTMGSHGVTNPDEFLGIEAPIVVSLVDQPAALFGQMCLGAGQAKCTYGTGCFLYLNTGNTPVHSHQGMLTTLVWSDEGRATYALEGGVYSAGSALDWLHDIGLLQSREEFAELVNAVESTEGVWFVPALTGLAAPYWDSDARGSFVGLSSATTKVHLAVAVLEGIAHRVADVVEAMSLESGKPLEILRVDGGLTNIPRLMQFQADVLGIPLEVSADHDATALGAAYMAGVHLGMMDIHVLRDGHRVSTRYEPRKDAGWRAQRRDAWKGIVSHVRSMSGLTS